MYSLHLPMHPYIPACSLQVRVSFHILILINMNENRKKNNESKEEGQKLLACDLIED